MLIVLKATVRLDEGASRVDSSPPGTEEEPRLPSSTPYLDQVLCGGWLQGGLYILAGSPGTGKTTLANQMCHHLAEAGVSSVYVSLLTETYARMLLHLRTLRFFHQEYVGTRIHYVSGASALKEGSAHALLELLFETVREKGARLLVIDGFPVVREQVRSQVAMREFLQALSVKAGLHGCTTFLLSTEPGTGMDVEHVMADGILALYAERVGLKATRELEMLKFRGSNHLAGRHNFSINENGVLVFPRYEVLNTRLSEKVADPDQRSRWGIPGLDEMCGGGLVTLSSTVIVGEPGSGKTLLGLHFLAEGARQGERGLYFGFSEGGLQLLRKATCVGLPLEALVASGTVRLESRAPVETLPDALAQEVVELVDAQHFRRLFLDGLGPIAREAIDPRRLPRFFSAFLSSLRDRGVTVLLAQQADGPLTTERRPSVEGVDVLCDNLLVLRFFERDGGLHRLLSVRKMRDSGNDSSQRELSISPQGVEVGPAYRAMETLLTRGPGKPPRPGTGKGRTRAAKKGTRGRPRGGARR
jgi:circadian clock protein KaiC